MKSFLYTCVRGFSEQLSRDFSLSQVPEGYWKTSKFQPFLTSLPPVYMHIDIDEFMHLFATLSLVNGDSDRIYCNKYPFPSTTLLLAATLFFC